MKLPNLSGLSPLVWKAVGASAVVALIIGATYHAGIGHERAAWERARLAWEDSTRALVQSADGALDQHATDSAQLDQNQRAADSLAQIAHQASQVAHQSRITAQVTNATAAAVTMALAGAQSVADSVPLLVRRDSARVATIAQLERAAVEDSVVIETDRERIRQLQTDLGLARADGTRLAGIVDSLTRKLNAAIIRPKGKTVACVVGASVSAAVLRLPSQKVTDYAGGTCGIELFRFRL